MKKNIDRTRKMSILEVRAKDEPQTLHEPSVASLNRYVSDQRGVGGRWEPYPGIRARELRFPYSPYIIQGANATVRGQTKLCCEGKPQVARRQAPEPPDTPGEA